MPVPSDAYTAWVERLWFRIQLATGAPPHYLEHDRLASYCPSCLDGTVSIRLLQRPRPGAAFTHDGAPGCSAGCSEELIMEALFG